MAIAGYNPEEISFWTRMAANSNGPPEFLVHIRSDASRIASLKQ
jgi:hypothetical protein